MRTRRPSSVIVYLPLRERITVTGQKPSGPSTWTPPPPYDGSPTPTLTPTAVVRPLRRRTKPDA